MTKKQKLAMSFDDALKANDHIGGSVVIDYGQAEIVAPRADVEDMVDVLRNMGPAVRAVSMGSVNEYLAQHIADVMAGKASQDVAMNVMQDIAIWFANEVFEGRRSLTKH